jgi:hypothetical protein
MNWVQAWGLEDPIRLIRIMVAHVRPLVSHTLFSLYLHKTMVLKFCAIFLKKLKQFYDANKNTGQMTGD